MSSIVLTCELCNYTGKQLHQHIKAVHKLNAKQYREMFGADKIMQIGFIPKQAADVGRSTYVKLGYNRIKQNSQNVEIYNRLELYDALTVNDTWKKYLGKTKYRTMINDNPRLYYSILEYTKDIPFKWSLEEKMRYIVEYNFNIDPIRCSCGKKVTFNAYCRRCPDTKKNCKGHSIETRKKQRLSTLNYLQNVKGQLVPRYNKNSITIIEEFAKQHGYSFQHAENGGEFFIKELGYWVDAYDPYNNVVLEIDENHHYDSSGVLSIRDQARQQQIEDLLKCKFFRIRV